MNEESADVKIKKNRRRIFDAESFVQYNQDRFLLGVQLSKKIEPLL